MNDGDSPSIRDDSAQADDSSEDSDGSVDHDLVDIRDTIPNWDTSSSIITFIKDNINRPLSDAVLKQLNSDFTPEEELTDYFLPPELPKQLFTKLAGMNSKGAIKTEKALYNAQKELFIVAKPIITALMELRPLGESVSKARELLSISLRGMFSVSIGLTRGRRENVRFLFDYSLGQALFSTDPTYKQMFGGKDFDSQLEKATKAAKLSVRPFSRNWKQPFQSSNKGFHFDKGTSKFFNPKGKKKPNNSRYNNNYDSNNNPPGKKSGSGRGKGRGGSSRPQE